MELNLDNKPLHEYLRENAKRQPEKTAIIFYGKKMSYGELDLYSDRLASYLNKKGIRKGDTVALYMQNCPQYMIAHFAIQKIGAIVGPCNPMFKEWELQYQLNDLEAKVLITLDSLVPIFENIKEQTFVQELIVSNYKEFLPEIPRPSFPETLEEQDVSSLSTSLYEIINDSSLLSPPCIVIEMKEDTGLVVYTSGTTGSPKGAMLTFGNSEFKTNCLMKTYSYANTDVFLSVMPVFHIAGMLVGMLGPIAVGGTIVLLTRFDPKIALESINEHQVTVAYTTPPMNIEMMKNEIIKKTNFSSLRLNLATSFGVQVSEEISNEWQQYSNTPLFEFAYGMSETHTGNALMPPDEIKYGTVGKPTYDTEVKIMDLEDNSKEVVNGQEGEIILRSPSVFKGYLNKQEATSESVVNGWFYTGDIGKFDDEGYLYFLGRNKEMIKCSGYSVYPEEVEKMLIKHPQVDQVAVIGVPDEKRGESVKAFVVLKQDAVLKAEDLVAWSKERMAAYKYPREVEFRGSLPQTSAGKLLRRLLREVESDEEGLSK